MKVPWLSNFHFFPFLFLKAFREAIKLAVKYKENSTDFMDEVLRELEVLDLTCVILLAAVICTCSFNIVAVMCSTSEYVLCCLYQIIWVKRCMYFIWLERYTESWCQYESWKQADDQKILEKLEINCSGRFPLQVEGKLQAKDMLTGRLLPGCRKGKPWGPIFKRSLSYM